MMKTRKLLLFATAALTMCGIALSALPPRVGATIDYNDLISPAVFNNSTSMTASQIDTFLNSFPSSCISTNNGFTANDPTAYTPTSSSIYGIYSYGSPVSAGQIIHDAAVSHQVNPKVILVTLEKEETLVSGTAGCPSWRYTSAVGYGCTDSGTNTHDYSYPGGGLLTPLYYINGSAVNSITGSCVNRPDIAGFSEQVIHFAWLMSFSAHRAAGESTWAAISGSWNHCDDNNTCPASMSIPSSWACYSGFMTQGTWARCSGGSLAPYDGYATIDSTSVHMDNGSTAALYVHTPHLSGNANFVTIFSSWFGSPVYAWAASIASVSTYSDSARTQPLSLASGILSGTTFYVTATATNTGNQTWTNSFVNLGTANPSDRTSQFQNNTWLNNARPTGLVESSVAPGQTGTFKFSVTTPNVDGVYHEGFGLVADGQNDGWMKDNSTFTLDITVSNPYNAMLTDVSTYSDSGRTMRIDPGAMTYGQTVYMSIKAQNIGTQTWSNASVHVGTSNPNDRTSAFQDGSWLSSTRPAALVESSVAPGQTGTFLFSITAPGAPSTSNEGFALVADGQSNGWMPNSSLSFVINVVAPPLDTLYSGLKLYPGQVIRSKNSLYTLVMQYDGNIVMYGGGHVIWASGSSGSPAAVVMQNDGNLVLYSTTGRVLWASNTNKGAATLVLQNDGNLVMYHGSQAVWASGTNINVVNTPSILSAGQQLTSGQQLLSANARYHLVLQSDGNLVEYSAGRAMWASNTAGATALVLQNDGNLVLYDASGHPKWASGTGSANTTLVLQEDGNIVLYAGAQPVWASIR